MLHEWYLTLGGLLFCYFVSNTQEITKNTLNISPNPQKTSRRHHSEISGIYIATCFQPFKTVKQLLNTLSITHHTWANLVILFRKCKFRIRKIWCWNSGSSTTKNYPDSMHLHDYIARCLPGLLARSRTTEAFSGRVADQCLFNTWMDNNRYNIREKRKPRGKERDQESRKGERECDAATRTEQGYLRNVKATAELCEWSLVGQV